MPSASPPFQGLATSERVKPLAGRQRLSGKSSNLGVAIRLPTQTRPGWRPGRRKWISDARYHADAIAATVEGRGGKCGERRTMRGDVARLQRRRTRRAGPRHSLVLFLEGKQDGQRS
jgi:hypothetical protein